MIKKLIFLMVSSVLVLSGVHAAQNISLLRPSVKSVQKLYTPDVNPENFERFIVFASDANARVYKYRARIADQIFVWAHQYEIDPLTILAILARETHFRYWRTGASGEIGIGQINPPVWLDPKNRYNLFNAGILKRGEEKKLRYIGRNIRATAHVLNVNRTVCFKWHDAGTLKAKGYRTINECMIRRYNGNTNTHKYYVGVTSFVGKFYFFVRNN